MIGNRVNASQEILEQFSLGKVCCTWSLSVSAQVIVIASVLSGFDVEIDEDEEGFLLLLFASSSNSAG